MSAESEAVLEERLLNKLENDGYSRINIRDEEELNQNFKEQLEKLNKCSLTDEEFRRILIYLNQGSIFDKAEKLRDKYLLEREDKPIHISFLNEKDWCKNIFQVSNQITQKANHTTRYDVTILINGLPLVQIELKRRGIEIKEAFNQINRYKKDAFKGLFEFVQIFVVSNGVRTKYFSNSNKKLDFSQTFFWKHEDNTNIESLEDFSETFLEKCNLAKIISQYMVLNKSSKTLMVLRAYQKYAVESILHQALEIKQNGYVWHTTGSGKTLTSFKTSDLLSKDPTIDKVIFVVDRRDLDIQTTQEFQSFCPDCVDYTYNTNALIKNLLSEKNKLITTTIQKLYRAVSRKDSEKKLESIKDKNIIFIYDECHRSQFGQMHGKIEDFFNNSLSFGFTGTPIFDKNSSGDLTTKSVFNKRLHSYLIKDAIRDNNVLGFSIDYYNTGKIKSDIVDKEVKSIDTNEYYREDKRIDDIVSNIIETYDAKTRNREFNAIFAVSRGGIVHDYYKKFKEKDHDLKVATIFSYNPNEEVEEGQEYSRDLLEGYIADYNEMFGTDFSTDNYKGYYADLSKRMKNREIDILLVVDMFLTGFDSKKLNTLFVDKNLEYHSLIQAFSRTNRVLNARKSQGNIICYRNLEEEVKEAVALFSDNEPIEEIIIPPYEYFVDKFNQALDELFKIVKTAADANKLERESEKESFVIGFRRLTRIKNKLDIFSQFTFEDLNIEEQEYNDFQSVYLDLHDEVKQNKGDEGPESILNDIDFELELIKNEKINVDYILDLLEELKQSKTSYGVDRERVLNLMSQTESLRSKIDLIEKFIDYRLPTLQDNVTVREEFDVFMKNEKKSAIYSLIHEENLDKDIACQIFDKYTFSEKFDNDLIESSFKDKLKFLERESKIEEIRRKIRELFERFDY